MLRYVVLAIFIIGLLFILGFSYSEGSVSISVPLKDEDPLCDTAYRISAGVRGVDGEKIRACMAY